MRDMEECGCSECNIMFGYVMEVIAWNESEIDKLEIG